MQIHNENNFLGGLGLKMESGKGKNDIKGYMKKKTFKDNFKYLLLIFFKNKNLKKKGLESVKICCLGLS